MSTNRKSDKELAFLHDLFIAPDWGERFAELIDEHVKLPKEGKALYVAAGTGGHAMALHERAGEKHPERTGQASKIGQKTTSQAARLHSAF